MGKVMNARLNTLADCRRFLSRTVNEFNRGEIEPDKARCIGYLISILTGCIKDSEADARITALENMTGDNRR